MHKTKTHIFLSRLFLALIIIAFSGCKKDELPAEEESRDLIEKQNIVINNNSAVLNQRLHKQDKLVSIDRSAGSFAKSESDEVDYTRNFAFKLKADVDAPEHNGKIFMATHVDIVDNFAFVSYNTRGSEYGGAVEVFDVSSLTNPLIISQAIFPEADINAISYADNKLYVVGAMEKFEEFSLQDPAFLQVLALNSQKEIINVDTIIDIASFSANAIEIGSDHIFITSGDQGDVSIFDRDLLEVKRDFIFDARSAAANSTHAYILSGQPGTISTYDILTAEFLSSFETGGANTPHSKSQIDLNNNYLFTALNEGGTNVYDFSGSLKQHIPKPETPTGGDDEKHVTNSVSVSNSLVFMANGESGISVGEIIDEQDDEIIILGNMVFSDMNSSNYVKSRDSIVFVASGLGGLKILSISIDEGVPDDLIPTDPCPTLLGSIIAMFPERENAMENHPYLFVNDVTLNVTTEKETEVYVKFVWEGAGWKNTFGYYAFPADNPPTTIADLQKHVIFPNVSLVGEGGGLEPGDMLQLGNEPFPANTVIGFYLVAQGWGNGEMVEGIYTHYTHTQFNQNNNQQHLLFIEEGCQDLVLTFEDIRLPGGDKDFNDIILVIKDNADQLPNTNFDVDGIINIGE